LETAEGIITIANANMEKAIRVISIERGIDPRKFVLFSFGGAGGMHSVEMASHLNIQRIIVPCNAGVLSALGLLLADSVTDYSHSILKTSDRVSQNKLDQIFQNLSEEGKQEMIKEGFNPNDIKFKYSLDLRYLGQSHEITIPYQQGASYLTGFHEEHHKLYSYFHPDQPVEIVNLRVKTIGTSYKIKLKKLPQQKKPPAKAALTKSQELYFQGEKYRASVFDRTKLKPGNTIPGPALVSDYESTTFLPPNYTLMVDSYLNLMIQRD
jgi:N-methylhydantoinase A/oxoprolinase/acetone carboxylase beta subunit